MTLQSISAFWSITAFAVCAVDCGRAGRCANARSGALKQQALRPAEGDVGREGQFLVRHQLEVGRVSGEHQHDAHSIRDGGAPGRTGRPCRTPGGKRRRRGGRRRCPDQGIALRRGRRRRAPASVSSPADTSKSSIETARVVMRRHATTLVLQPAGAPRYRAGGGCDPVAAGLSSSPCRPSNAYTCLITFYKLLHDTSILWVPETSRRPVDLVIRGRRCGGMIHR
jgi:hypothetical protein